MYSELKQKPNTWLKLSKSAKQQFLNKVQLQEVKGKQYISQENQDIENIPPLSMSFDETGLSHIVYKCMWDKAAVLHHEKLISDVPGYADGKMVASKSCPGKPHLVSSLKSGKFTCDCINYKSKSLCSHVIAVAESTSALPSSISWFTCTNQEPSLWKLSQSSGVPKNPGLKAGQSRRKARYGISASPEVETRSKFNIPSLVPTTANSAVGAITNERSSISILSPITAPTVSVNQAASITITSPITAPTVTCNGAISQSSPPSVSIESPITASSVSIAPAHIISKDPFCAKFITERITKCQGCRSNFRHFAACSLYPPADLIACRLERRPFIGPDGSVKVPTTPRNLHYHLDSACL